MQIRKQFSDMPNISPRYDVYMIASGVVHLSPTCPNLRKVTMWSNIVISTRSIEKIDFIKFWLRMMKEIKRQESNFMFPLLYPIYSKFSTLFCS